MKHRQNSRVKTKIYNHQREENEKETKRRSTVNSPKSSLQHLKQCTICRIQAGTLYTPNCKTHLFCTSCINLHISSQSPRFCDYCSLYFDSISKEIDSRVLKCTTCKRPPNVKRFCKVHEYCKVCFDFFLLSDKKSYKIIESCSECSSYFKNYPQKIVSKSPDLKFNIDPMGNYLNYNENKEIGDDGRRDYLRNPPINEISPSLFQINSPKIVLNNIFQEDYKSSPHRNQGAVKVFQHPALPRPISRGNLGSQKKDVAKIAQPYFDNRDYTPSNKQITRTEKFRVAKSTSPNKIRLQIFGEIGKDKVPELKKRIKFQKKLPKIDFQSASPRNFNEKNHVNSTLKLTSLCSHCGKEDETRGFLCNHNFCIECIVYTGIQQINNFFELYQYENQVAYFEFFFECPIESCGNKISIPCHLIMNKLAEYLDKGIERFKCFGKYHYKTYEYWPHWIPYFDGLGFHIYK